MSSRQKTNRQPARFCAQVAQIASLVLGSSRDPRLQQVLIHSVSAASNGARLIIHVRPMQPLDFTDLEQLMSSLDTARGWMRAQIAESINRKRTPEVLFQVVLGCQEDPP